MHYLKELTFDELGIDRLSELFIHFKGDEEFYKYWNSMYREKFENFLNKKKKGVGVSAGGVKSEIDLILEEFLAYW